jgi:hypothetical protein
VKVGSHGSGRHVESVGDLTVLPSLQVVQKDDLALHLVQRAESPGQPLA